MTYEDFVTDLREKRIPLYAGCDDWREDFPLKNPLQYEGRLYLINLDNALTKTFPEMTLKEYNQIKNFFRNSDIIWIDDLYKELESLRKI